MIQAYFNNINQQLIKELNRANESILLAVAWFTDNDLFEILCNKSKQGLLIEIILVKDEINLNSSINYSRLEKSNGKVWFVEVTKMENRLMHNKFCVIDNNTVITGSYNWSYKARRNHENITISYENKDLADKFIFEFNRIKEFYFGIKNQKDVPLESNEIILYDDFEMSALNFELKSLEMQIRGLENEKADIDKELNNYNTKYNKVLGNLIIVLLELKEREIIKNSRYSREHNEILKDLNDYKKTYKFSEKIIVFELEKNQKEELKNMFRKASKLCHPDLVIDELKSDAETVFKELKNAYELNDIKQTEKILNMLEKDIFISTSTTYSTKDVIESKIQTLKLKRDKLEREIIRLRNSDTYLTLSNIENIDKYLYEQKSRIQEEIEYLKNVRE